MVGDIERIENAEWGIWMGVVMADMDKGRGYGWGKDLA